MKDLTLAERMLRYRAAHNINQRELAKLAGVSLQTINYLEREKQTPSRVTRTKIEMVLEKGE